MVAAAVLLDPVEGERSVRAKERRRESVARFLASRAGLGVGRDILSMQQKSQQ